MKKPNRQTVKAFAIASTIGAVLKSNNIAEPKLLAMQVQINRAMKVFSHKAGRKFYWEVSNEIAQMWETLAGKHNNEILDEEVPKFIEYLCTLVPPQDFKAFLGISPYYARCDLRPEINVRVVHSILELDEGLNKMLGTKPYTLTKPKQRIIKEKKERDKGKTKTKEVKVSSAKIKKSEDRKRKQRLKDMIAAAKKKRDEND